MTQLAPIAKVMELAGMLPKSDIREAIHTLQDAVLGSEADTGPESAPVRHTFVNGVYAREITMLAGMFVIGRIHKHAHLNFIMEGAVRVLTEHEGSQEYKAPFMFVSPAGTKRLVYVLEDCVWVTIHPTNKTDPDEVVEEVTVEDYSELELAGEFKVVK